MLTRLVAGAAALVLLVLVVVAVNRQAAVEEVALAVSVDGGRVDLDTAMYLPPGTTNPAPAVLLAHGFGSSRESLTELAEAWARRGYVAVTWSARGFGRSGGQIGLADPAAEIADVSVIIDVLAGRSEIVQDADGDPTVAIAGGSYGGGTALLAAVADPRLDSVVAVSAWHDLPRALAPGVGLDGGVLKAQWVSLLFTAGSLPAGGGFGDGAGEGGSGDVNPGAGGLAAGGFGADLLPLVATGLAQLGDPSLPLCGRFTPAVCEVYADSAARGQLSDGARRLLSRANPGGGLADVDTPTLLVHHLDDTLFGLVESLDNARALAAGGAPVRLRWLAGGHAGLGAPGSASDTEMVAWLERTMPLLASDRTPASDTSEDPPAPFSWVDGVSGQSQEGPLPIQTTADGMVMGLGAGGGMIPIDGADVASSTGRQVIAHPPAGLPAAISTLPGLGDLGGLAGLLPTLDIPGQATSFTSEALVEDLILLGEPVLTITADRLTLDLGETGDGSVDDAGTPVGVDPDPVRLFAKLFDVTPGGSTSLLMSTVTPLLLPPGRTTTVTLDPLAHRLVAGNRLRLVLATTDQAFAPVAPPAVYEVDLDGAALALPTGAIEIGNPLPAAVRIAIPVLLVVAGAILGAALTRRRERHLALTPTTTANPASEHPGPSHTADTPAIRITGLAKRYADGKVAVDGIDLEVHRGQVFGLLGPNGAGKTTTMRMLLGLITPTTGTVELLGQRVVPGHPVFKRVGVLVEGPGFAPYLSGRANLESYWRAGGSAGDANLQRALDVADLGSAIDRPTRTYSHGMRQRLAIAQALLGDPELLVLDEPTDGLDPEQIRHMRQLLARLGAEGITILVSSHLLSEVEQMCTHAAVVQRGKLVAAGAVSDLVGATQTVVIRTDDRARATDVLTPLLASGAIDVEGDGLAVTLGDTAAADLVAALVEAGLRVDAVSPRGRLEDTFLALTGGKP